MKTVGKKLLVKKLDSTETSSSGLITMSLTQNKGEVLAVGPDVVGVRAEDIVLWTGPSAEVTVKGTPVVVLTEDNVLLVL